MAEACAAHPELAEDIRKRLAALQRLGMLEAAPAAAPPLGPG